MPQSMAQKMHLAFQPKALGGLQPDVLLAAALKEELNPFQHLWDVLCSDEHVIEVRRHPVQSSAVSKHTLGEALELRGAVCQALRQDCPVVDPPGSHYRGQVLGIRMKRELCKAVVQIDATIHLESPKARQQVFQAPEGKVVTQDTLVHPSHVQGHPGTRDVTL